MTTLARPRIQKALALAASGASLTALVVFGVAALPAQASVIRDAPALSLELRLLAAEEQQSAQFAVQTAEPTPAEPEPASAPIETQGPETAEATAEVAIPDVSGERLWIARKHLSDAGLKMVAREGRRRIPISDYPDYQVDSEQVFGAPVEPGSVVEVQVEWWAPVFARGY